MLQKVVELSKDKNGNYLISPISLQMALGMTATGSDKGSTTQKELMNVLLPGTGKDPSSLNKQMATFAKRMKNSKDVQWNVANSVWVNNNGEVKLRDSYVKNTTNYYAAELYAAPFDDSTVKAINDWVSKNTKKRIPKILNEISDDARIALVNALAFDAAWATPYDKSQEMKNQTFTNSDGTKSKVTMLTSGEQKAIKLAGGLTSQAYAEGAKLLRRMTQEEREQVEVMLRTAQRNSGKDSIDISKLMVNANYPVGIELDKALKNPGTSDDPILREGDRIVVPRFTSTVTVNGEVLYPNTVRYKEGRSVGYYIDQAGGFTSSAKKSKTIIIYMNGMVAKASYNNRPKPGCQIVVPSKKPRQGFGLQQWLSLGTTAASLGTMIATIANLTK